MNKLKKLLLLLLFICVSIQFSLAQLGISSSNKKAINKFEQAKTFFYKKEYEKSIRYANKALDIDNKFLEAYLIASESNIELENFSSSISLLQKMLQINPSKYSKAWKLLGELQMEVEAYDDAIYSFNQFIVYHSNEDISKELSICEFRKHQILNPKNIQLINLGKNVNSDQSEYINAISLDENRIYFTVKPEMSLSDNSKNIKTDEDFYFSLLNNGSWNKREAFDTIINSPYNEGAMHISADNRFLFFTSCRDQLGFGSCDLYFSSKENDTTWREPFNLGETINSAYWDTQPCFSSDGKTLFFVSNRDNGYGQSDIWYATLKSDGTWNDPKNLGNVINSKGDEMAPYLHPDGKTLYFSSNGHIGMGGMDIFMSKKLDDDTWSEPINLGHPINTKEDEINLIVNANGNKAYISTNRDHEEHYDIYQFDLPIEFEAHKTAYINGIIKDYISKEPIQAIIELIDLEKGHTKVISASQPDGTFLIALPTGKSYALHIKKEGYMFYTEHFDFNHTAVKTTRKDVYLHPIQDNLTAELKNIFFDFDSDELLPSSKPELNTLIKLLKKNPKWHLTIIGYTDNQGKAAYNQKLSENRAKSVYNYLINNGIKKENLSYMGMGEKNPKADNSYEDGRAINRRTEVMFNN